MSTLVAVVLFVIGVGALILSAVMDRRTPVRRGADREVPADAGEAISSDEPEATEAIEADADLGTEADEAELAPEATGVAVAQAADLEEQELPAAELEERAAVEPGSEDEPADQDRAAAAEARLQRLRAELTGSIGAGQPEERSEELSQEPSHGAETTASDARRVFAAVAAVGQAPVETEVPSYEPTEPEPSAEPEASEPEAEGTEVSAPEVEAAASGELGHQHAVPLVNHSDLVTHLRSQHLDLESSGSTIQMRLLHERRHAEADA